MEKYRRFEKVFHLLEKKRGLVRYFLNKFLSIREKERISHPVFIKVLLRRLYLLEKKARLLKLFCGKFLQKKLPLQI